MSLLSQQLHRSALPIVVVDGDRRFVDVNQAACLMVERPRFELLTMRVDDLTPSARIPELEARWSEFLREGVANGRWALARHGAGLVEFEYVAMAAVAPDRHLLIGTVPEAEDSGPAGEPVPGAVTSRERTVLTLLALGRTGPEIAEELTVSLDTVRTHIRALKGKLGARTLAHLVAIALRDGLVDE
jgi:DNA-binding CsgD family transcriptional regulator